MTTLAVASDTDFAADAAATAPEPTTAVVVTAVLATSAEVETALPATEAVVFTTAQPPANHAKVPTAQIRTSDRGAANCRRVGAPLVVVGGIAIGKEFIGKTKLIEVFDPHRVQGSVQVITLVLYDPGVKPFGNAINHLAGMAPSVVAQLGDAIDPAAHTRHRQTPLQPPSVVSVSGVMVGLMRTVGGTAGASGYRSSRSKPKITIRWLIPICGAASPAPPAARMVSNISSISSSNAGVPICAVGTFSAFCSNRGSPMRKIRWIM
jgi:hypothetical protein